MNELGNACLNLRKRERALIAELHGFEAMAIDQQAYLQLAESVEEVLSRLRASASTLNLSERQNILRLVVEELLVDRETIAIRQSIPVTRLNPIPAPGDVKLPIA